MKPHLTTEDRIIAALRRNSRPLSTADLLKKAVTANPGTHVSRINRRQMLGAGERIECNVETVGKKRVYFYQIVGAA